MAYNRYRILVSANNGREFTGAHTVEFRIEGGMNLALNSLGSAFASSEFSTGTAATSAFDGNSSTAWVAEGSPISWPQHIGITFPHPVVVTQYAIGAYGTAAGQENGSFKDWKLQGSNDGVTWDDLDEQSGVTDWSHGTLKSYDVDWGAPPSDSPLKVWDGSEWVSTGVTVDD